MISKNFRLNKADTEWTLKKGGKLVTDLFIVRYLKLDQTLSKKPGIGFATITSTKLSKKAVDRNRIKRKISEALRLNLDKIKNQGRTWKVAIIPKKRILDVEYEKIEEDIISLITRLNNE